MPVRTHTSAWLIATLVLMSARQSEGVQVNTSLGLIYGFQRTEYNTSINVFLGVPYAQPPIGDLRFRRPRPMTALPNNGFNASHLPNTCYQINQTSFLFNLNTPMSEDCLYLNIWLPSAPSSDPAGRPIMVWIHGGAFNSGTSTIPWHDGGVLAAVGDVIVVSMQYRVGPLGFLYLATDDIPGNFGLIDQQLAIQWVHDHIQSFGGDPTRVTLFGESAGAASVGVQLLSPLSRELVSGAIMQSGNAAVSWAFDTPEKALSKSLKVANMTACTCGSSSADIGACLRGVHIDALLAAWYVDPLPTVDGYFVAEAPLVLLQSGNFSKVNILLGSNLNEGSSFLPSAFPQLFPDNYVLTKQEFDVLVQNVLNFLLPTPPVTVQQTTIFEYAEPSASLGIDQSYRDLLGDILGDPYFTCPTVRTAKLYAAKDSPVFLYEFIHRTSNNPWPLWMGVMHAFEIDHVFGVPLASWNTHAYTQDEEDFARTMVLYWTNFAHTGNPNQGPASSLVTWPRYNVTDQQYLILNTVSLTTGQYLRARKCLFFETVVPQLTEAAAACYPTTTVAETTTTVPAGGATHSHLSDVIIFASITLLMFQSIFYAY